MKATTSATTCRWIPLRKAGRYHRFIEQARELGMRVIIELLIQHTSDAHPAVSSRPAVTRRPLS